MATQIRRHSGHCRDRSSQDQAIPTWLNDGGWAAGVHRGQRPSRAPATPTPDVPGSCYEHVPLALIAARILLLLVSVTAGISYSWGETT